MEIRKGPFGQFAVETTSKKIYKYAAEIINRSVSTSFLPVYINRSSEYTELAYDFSGMTQIRCISGTHEMRKAAADLFLSIIRCPDLLLPTSLIHFDEDYIFYDKENNSFHICVPPILPDSNDSAISTIDGKQLESFLNNSLFAQLLSRDEIDELCSCILTNNDDKAEALLIRIKNTPMEVKAEEKFIDSKQLSITCCLGILALIASPTSPLVAILSSIGGLGLLGYYLLKNKTNYLTQSDKIKLDNIKERKEVLFNTEENYQVDSPGYLVLKSKQKVAGDYLNKAIYTDMTTIGSDCFLSDICIDSKSVSSIHMQITVKGGSYYATDKSSNNESYIENIRMIPYKEYEIKNGQVLRCGDFDFDICIEY